MLLYFSKYNEVTKHQHKRALVLSARKLERLIFGLLQKINITSQFTRFKIQRTISLSSLNRLRLLAEEELEMIDHQFIFNYF